MFFQHNVFLLHSCLIFYCLSVIFGILDTGKGGETGMKKTLSESVLIKEAALWEKMKEAVQKHPATACHK
jgi:hypothetical protein